MGNPMGGIILIKSANRFNKPENENRSNLERGILFQIQKRHYKSAKMNNEVKICTTKSLIEKSC